MHFRTKITKSEISKTQFFDEFQSFEQLTIPQIERMSASASQTPAKSSARKRELDIVSESPRVNKRMGQLKNLKIESDDLIKVCL
jgi:hypothetical protein